MPPILGSFQVRVYYGGVFPYPGPLILILRIRGGIDRVRCWPGTRTTFSGRCQAAGRQPPLRTRGTRVHSITISNTTQVSYCRITLSTGFVPHRRVYRSSHYSLDQWPPWDVQFPPHSQGGRVYNTILLSMRYYQPFRIDRTFGTSRSEKQGSTVATLKLLNS